MAHRLLRSAALLAFLLPFTALAQQYPPPSSGTEANGPPVRGVDKGVEFGAFLQYFSADPVLSAFYQTHTSVTGTTFGGYFVKRSPGGSRLMIDVAYTTTDPQSGIWLATGKQTSSNEWTVFNNFRIYTADLIYGHEWTKGGFFGWWMGGGIGVAYTTGTINGFATLPPNYTTQDPAAAPDNKLKSMPPVIPTVVFRTGPSFNFGDFGALYIEAGLHDGLFAGARFGIQL
jgi:hypothetical protein